MARSRFALKRRFDVDLTSVWRRFDVSLTSTCLSGLYLSPCQVVIRIGALFTFHSKSRVVSAKYRDPRFSSSRCEIHWIRAHSHPDRCRERISKKYRKLTKIWPFWRFGRWNGGWKSELLLRLERELSEMSEPVQLGKTWMHAKERRKLLENWAIGSLFRFWAKWNWNVKLCETLKRPKMRIFRKFKTLWRSVNFFQTARETTASLRRRIKELTFLCKATELTWVLP